MISDTSPLARQLQQIVQARSTIAGCRDCRALGRSLCTNCRRCIDCASAAFDRHDLSCSRHHFKTA